MIPSFVSVPLFAGAMVFGAMANGLAFFILYRMRSLGYGVGLWRTSRDWALHREYWENRTIEKLVASAATPVKRQFCCRGSTAPHGCVVALERP